ncbi:hypothetical protein [Nocardia sp. NPDC050406]|uniref:hypothetical protein n=1 Tax=Nocardia sp. NPDC050406 TaxID=3364318 RepID=UPI0037A4CFD9
MRETATPPAEYRPDNALTRPTLGVVGEIVLGLLLLAVTVVATVVAFYLDRHGDYGIEIPIAVSLVFLTITVMYTATTLADRLAEPGIYVGDDSVVVGSYIWRDAKFYSTAGWVLCGALWLLVGLAVVPGYKIFGYALFGLAVYEVVKAVYHARRNRLVLNRDSLRVIVGDRDLEFPWEAIAQLRGEHVKVDKKSRPEIEFHCAPTYVLAHSGSPEPESYKILFTGLPVRPDALLATMEFMTGPREQRERVSLEQIAVMLRGIRAA